MKVFYQPTFPLVDNHSFFAAPLPLLAAYTFYGWSLKVAGKGFLLISKLTPLPASHQRANSYSKMTPLLIIARERVLNLGHRAILKVIFKKAWFLDFKDSLGKSALHYAVENGHFFILGKLNFSSNFHDSMVFN